MNLNIILCHVIFATHSSLHPSIVQCGSSGPYSLGVWNGTTAVSSAKACVLCSGVGRPADTAIHHHQPLSASSQIWPDKWSAYRDLNPLGNIHETLNHSSHFLFTPCSAINRYTVTKSKKPWIVRL